MTCHKAQGATVDVALLYGAGALTREAGYVALSRGRAANHLYVAEPDDRERPLAAGDGTSTGSPRASPYAAAQTLATRQLPRADGRRLANDPPSPTPHSTATEGIAR